MYILKHPTVCNVCGGTVKLIPHPLGYEGKVYMCMQCKAYVCASNRDEALGTLADADTRRMRQECHRVFDQIWASKLSLCCNSRSLEKAYETVAYEDLADRLGILPDYCHFAMMDLPMLEKAYDIITTQMIPEMLSSDATSEKPPTESEIILHIDGIFNNSDTARDETEKWMQSLADSMMILRYSVSDHNVEVTDTYGVRRQYLITTFYWLDNDQVEHVHTKTIHTSEVTA